MESIYQVIYKIIVAKDFDIKVYDYIYPWGKTLDSVAWLIRAYYHRTLGFMHGQSVFGIDMLFNLMLIVDWRVVTTRKQRQGDIDNFLQKRQEIQA